MPLVCPQLLTFEPLGPEFQWAVAFSQMPALQRFAPPRPIKSKLPQLLPCVHDGMALLATLEIGPKLNLWGGVRDGCYQPGSGRNGSGALNLTAHLIDLFRVSGTMFPA